MSGDIGIGKLITSEQHRDAIHVAVIPMVADVPLMPGQHVGLTVDGKANPHKPSIGVVDPWLADSVGVGQTFWLCLKPRSVESLRHEWTHLSFDGDDLKAKSEAWLRDFCHNADCPGYETVMKALNGDFGEDNLNDCYGGGGYIDNAYLHFDGRDAHGSIPDEFWHHAEIVLGKTLEEKPRYFSCSC